MNACWFLTEIKALVHALATKGNEYYRIVSVVYVRVAVFKCVPLCISFAYPLEKISGKMSPCSLKIQTQTTLPLNHTFDSTKVNLVIVFQNNVYLSYSTSPQKKRLCLLSCLCWCASFVYSYGNLVD